MKTFLYDGTFEGLLTAIYDSYILSDRLSSFNGEL